jgi:8-oxo-dGTP pyrophosphatase MutT (NUDIX family)
MIEYVVIDAFPVDSDKVLLIHKNKPDYLKGLFNLVGGKIEEGETPTVAAMRELKEESGLDISEYDPMVFLPPSHCGMVLGTRSIIHCVRVPVSIRQELRPGEGETEPVAWFDFIGALNHPKLMPNLRVVLPLMRSGARGWEVIATGDWTGENHSLEIVFAGCDQVTPIVATVKGLAHYEK